MKAVVTGALRFLYFAFAIVPLASLTMPWVTLLDNGERYTGVACIALLVSPIRDYLFAVAPAQAAIITLAPALTVVVSIAIGVQYYKRERKAWLPFLLPLLPASVVALVFLTPTLSAHVHAGPILALFTASFLILHQIAIHVWVSRRKIRMPSRISRPLAIAAGIRRWR